MTKTVTAPTTWAELAEFATTKVEFPRSAYEPKGARRVQTEWVLAERTMAGGKVEKIVVQLTTSHDKDSKVFRSRLGYVLRSNEPGSPFTVEQFGVFDQASVLVHREPVARYAKPAILAAHETALGIMEVAFDQCAKVFTEALERHAEVTA